jgi:hypothetical protein
MPTPSGSVIVGEKVENVDDVKSNMTYVVVSRNEGIVYKRILRANRTKNKLTLVSDNPAYKPYTINADEILEIWQAQYIIAKASQHQRWDVDHLANVVNSLHQQVSILKKRMN